MTDSLGPYRLGPNDENQGIYTGDARELAKAIPDESVDLIFTDPVYQNIDDYRWLAETAARVLKPDSACLVSFGIGYLDNASHAMRGYGLTYRWEMVWYQSNNMQRADTGFCKWSPIRWYEKGRTIPRRLVQDLRNIPVEIGRGRQDDNHKWAKRTELIEYYLEPFCDFGAIVFDPFTGGGTVPAVCKMLGRKWLAFEIDPAIAETARERVRMTQPPLFVPQPEQGVLKL